MAQPDLLVFMTDQHAPGFSSYEGGPARTENMEKLCELGNIVCVRLYNVPSVRSGAHIDAFGEASDKNGSILK